MLLLRDPLAASSIERTKLQPRVMTLGRRGEQGDLGWVKLRARRHGDGNSPRIACPREAAHSSDYAVPDPRCSVLGRADPLALSLAPDSVIHDLPSSRLPPKRGLL